MKTRNLIRSLAVSSCCLSLLIGFSASANPFEKFWQKTKGNYYVGFDTGLSSVGSVGKEQVLNINHTGQPDPDFGYRYYSASTKNNNLFDYGVVAGLKTKVSSKFNLLWGIGIYQMSDSVSVDGLIYKDQRDNSGSADSSYSYKYSVGPRLMAQLEAEYQIKPNLFPFVQLGIGYAQVELKDYTAHTLQGGSTLPNVAFPDTKKGKMVYQAAIGLNYHLAKHWVLGVSYGILNLGKVSFNADPNKSVQVTSAGLETKDVNVQQVMLNVRYFF